MTIKTGALVRVRPGRFLAGKQGIITEARSDGSLVVEIDGLRVDGVRSDVTIVRPQPATPSLALPKSLVTLSDGRQLLCDRDDRPSLERTADGVVRLSTLDRVPSGASWSSLWGDDDMTPWNCPEIRAACRSVLASWQTLLPAH